MDTSGPSKGADADAQKTQINEDVNIYLNETPTIFLWQQPTSCANSAGPEAEAVNAANKRYTDFCQAIATSENYTGRGVLTFHLFTKDKESQTDEVKRIEEEVQLDLHNLVDADKQKKAEKEITPFELLHESCHPLASHEWSKTKEEDLKKSDIKVNFGPNSSESTAIMHEMKTIGNSLFVLERMVQQNIHLDKILSYTSPAAEVDSPNVESLLKFQNLITNYRPVTGLSFNPSSVNFFAASYGPVAENQKIAGKKTPEGLICVWNILNPSQPERIIETESSPTSIKFSEGVPYLIAAGFSDGAVGLFDIRQKKCECIAMSTVENGSHEGTVGEVVFQQRTDTRVRSEAVVSVAAGGRVTQWTVANGLEHKDLVTLKKLKVVGKENETQTLRYEDLHCISFSQSQPNIYVVGSEDGALFVCDTQYNEDFTQKLLFHFRSVLSVKFSPIAPNWFISGSCDGSAAVWNTHRQTPVAAFYLTKGTFNDIEWSPISGTVFAAACSDGECKIWDISLDSVDPVARLSPYDKKEFTSLDWSPHLPVFISGTVGGIVYLTKVVGLASLTSGRSKEEEVKRFTSVIQMMSNQE